MKKTTSDRTLIQTQPNIAEALGISERTLRRWLESSDKPPVWRIHGIWCAFAEDLEEWRENQATKA
jgi:hypothetical protein